MVDLILMFLGHFVGDFLLQSRDMGKKKSENFEILFSHLAIVFATTFVFLLFAMPMSRAIPVALANAIIHGVIDWNIWKLYKLYAMKSIKEAAQEIAWAKRLSIVNKLPEQIKMEKMECLIQAREQFKYWEDHWFYATIGFDQLLHALTMIVLIYAI